MSPQLELAEPRRKDFICPFKGRAVKRPVLDVSSLARLKMLSELGEWSLLQLLKYFFGKVFLPARAWR